MLTVIIMRSTIHESSVQTQIGSSAEGLNAGRQKWPVAVFRRAHMPNRVRESGVGLYASRWSDSTDGIKMVR